MMRRDFFSKRSMQDIDLIVLDAGPMNKLATINHLDLLLEFKTIYVPDEIFFEAAEKASWLHKY